MKISNWQAESSILSISSLASTTNHPETIKRVKYLGEVKGYVALFACIINA